MIESEEGYFRP